MPIYTYLPAMPHFCGLHPLLVNPTIQELAWLSSHPKYGNQKFTMNPERNIQDENNRFEFMGALVRENAYFWHWGALSPQTIIKHTGVGRGVSRQDELITFTAEFYIHHSRALHIHTFLRSIYPQYQEDIAEIIHHPYMRQLMLLALNNRFLVEVNNRIMIKEMLLP